MTRINSAIPPCALTDKHLLTEHREILRMVHHWKISKRTRFPEKFVFGPGHVNFFINKQKFIYERYLALYQECLARNYFVTDWSQLWKDQMFQMRCSGCWNDHIPTREEYELQIQRIEDKLKVQKHTYHKEPITDFTNDVLIKFYLKDKIYGQK